jgi:hypothetical protein
MRRVRKATTCLLGRGHGAGPVAGGLLKLRTVHEALAAERDQIGLGCAPPGEGCRPLRCPRQIELCHAFEDHRAVHDAGGDRADLAAGDRQHDVVEAAESVCRPSHADEGLAAGEEPERLQVTIAEPSADLARLYRQVVRRGGICVEHTQELRDQQIAGRRALDARVVDEPPRPGEPAAGLRHPTPQKEAERDPPGVPRRRRTVAGLDGSPIGLVPSPLARDVITDEERRDGASPVVVDRQWRIRRGDGERVGRLTPGSRGEGCARVLE